MKRESKPRILYLLKILYEQTDENHPLSTAELIRLMNKLYDIQVYRTTLASDIEQLLQFGIEIYTIKSTQNKYFLIDRVFDIPELKLLIDAVESSKFITAKKSNELVEKLISLVSQHSAKDLKSNLHSKQNIKPKNEKVYYIVDTINDAINSGKKISFQYFQYNEEKEKQLKNDGRPYVFSPYTLTWDSDRYYAVGYSDKHQDVGVFRVDRIYRQPEILEENAVPVPTGVDLAEHIKTMLRMYDSKRETVELICDNSMMNAVVDNFGEEITTCTNNAESFKATVDVAVSPVFFRWVFGYEGKIQIKSPEHIKQQYREMLNKAVESLL